MEQYFAAFGQVNQVAIIRNKQTGLSKCYAFIHTSDKRTYQRILGQKHFLQGRMIDCKDGFSRDDNPHLFEKMNSKKFFVGGLSANTSDKDLLEYFSGFGEVFKAYVIVDPNTGRSKRFGFVIMEMQEGVDEVMSAGKHAINGHAINCKRFDRSLADKANDPESEPLAESPTKTKAVEIMEMETSSPVFNRLSQVWSFARQPSTIIFRYVCRKGPSAQDQVDFHDIDNYRGPKPSASNPKGDQPPELKFKFCMNPYMYQKIEDWHQRVCDINAQYALSPMIYSSELEANEMNK